MIQQAYYTPKFAAEAQAQAADSKPLALMRAVFNYFRNGWDNNLENAEVVGKSGSYIG